MRTFRKLFAGILATFVAVGLFAPPVTAAAPLASDTATLTLNFPTGLNPVPVGADFSLVRTQTIDPATGVATEVTEAARTVTVGETITVNQWSVYELTMRTRPNGYLLDTETYILEWPIMENGTYRTDQNATMQIKLDPVLGTASLNKTADTSTGSPVVGATFNLFRTADASGTAIDPAAQVGTTLTTGPDGTITAADLPEGSYYFVEVGTVDPYAVDTSTQYPFRVTANAAGTETIITTADEAATQITGPINAINYTQPSPSNVTKKVNGAVTANASIGETVTYTVDAVLPNDIADYSTYTIQDLVPSQFSNVRVTGTPTGFTSSVSGNEVTFTGTPADLAPGTVTFTITATLNNTFASGTSVDNVASVTWDNGKGDSRTFNTTPATVSLVEGSITVNKRDGATLTALPGATFILTNSPTSTTPINDINGNPYQAQTNADGQIVFNRLPYGTYYLREIVAPDGYRLADTAFEVTVNSSNINAVPATINNWSSDLPEWLPDTGSWAELIAYVIGGGLLTWFFIAVVRRRRDDEPEGAQA